MRALDTPEQDPGGPGATLAEARPEQAPDPLARFRSWRGFLFASVAVNALFVYGMLGGMADPSVATWYKALVWLPFNVIASAIYLAIMARLAKAGGVFYGLLCGVMIVANWVVLLVA